MTLAVNKAGVVGAFIAERRAKDGERACGSCSPRRLMPESRLVPLRRSRRQNAGNQRQKKSRNEDIPRTATTLE